MRRQRKLQPNDSIVHLPLYGQLCIPVHRGYKIFNIRKRLVAKVFDSDVTSFSILNEIERLKKISLIDFAPTLKRWDIEKRWYEEEFVSGFSNEASQKRLDSSILLKKFYHDIAPCLDSLILLQNPITENSIEYINGTTRILEVSRLSRQDRTVTEYKKIKSFLDSMVQRLRGEGNCLVHLVFTHGDFCPANMVNTKDGLKILDWECAKYRSALFDFYTYFFYRPVSKKIPVGNLVSEIKEALPFVISMLAKNVPEIADSLRNMENVYRWIYYIEQVCSEMEREMTDKNLPILDYILDYIEAFNQYEELIACKAEELSSRVENNLARN